ncbi:MAG: TonB family protein [Gammaproteobacteria bacterium]
MTSSDARPLIGFLAASLLIHAALLGWLRTPVLGTASGVAGVPHLTVALLHTPYRDSAPERSAAAPKGAARKHVQPPDHRSTAPHRTARRMVSTTPVRPPHPGSHRSADNRPRHPASRAVTRSTPSDNAPKHSAAAPSPTSAAPGHPSSPRNAARHGTLTQRLRKALTKGLERHFHYPPLARERGWQGQVILSLRIDRTGHISGLKVAHSSGYPVLDRAALHSLQQVHRLPLASSWLDGRDVKMELPVRYQLIDS